MKPLIAAFVFGLLLIAGGLYYQFVYPPSVLKRETEKSLQQFADAVATKDRTKISGALTTLLTDDVKIHLEVSFFALIQTSANKPMVQDFDKAQFIQFLDNVLYPLADYSYTPRLETFVLAEDATSAAVTFTSSQWADGASLFGGVSVDTRTSSDASCEGKVRFIDEAAHLSEASCKLTLRTVPKPGQAEKIQGEAEALKEYLQR